MRAIFILAALIGSSWASAAPHPATSSSSLIAADKGMFWSKLGFAVNAGSSSWIHDEAPRGTEGIATLYRAPSTSNGVQATLTVRTDELNRGRSFRSEWKLWTKDFRRLGFDILATRGINIAGQSGYLLDLIHQESEKQLRQVVFVKDQRLVVLTCRDHKSSFQETVKSCNEIVRTFRWTR